MALNCFQDLNLVVEWFCQNQLLINSDKTKFVLFGTKQQLGKLNNPVVSILGKTLTPEKICKDLGIYLDSGMTFDTHINTLTSSLLSTLCKINRVRHLFDKSVILMILNSLIFSRLFIVLLYGLALLKEMLVNFSRFRNLPLVLLLD